MGNLNVGHGGTYDQPNGGEFGRVAVLYLKWRLKGDVTVGRNFVGADCGLCHTEWTVQQKNLTLDGDTPPSTPSTTPPPGEAPAARPPESPGSARPARHRPAAAGVAGRAGPPVPPQPAGTGLYAVTSSQVPGSTATRSKPTSASSLR